MFFLLFAAHAADIDAYNALTMPESVDDKAAIEALSAKIAGLQAIESDVTVYVEADNPPEDEVAQLVVLGQAYEEMGAFLIHSTPPLYLNGDQAGIYQSMIADRAVVQCEKARQLYGMILEKAPKDAAATAGRERLSLEVEVPSHDTIEAEVEAWLATWPRAERPQADPPPPETAAIGGTSKKEKKKKKKKKKKGQQSLELHGLVGVHVDDDAGGMSNIYGPVVESAEPIEVAPVSVPKGGVMWAETLSRPEVQACMLAKDF